MFENEEELKNPLPNKMQILIISSNPQKADINKKIQEKIGIEFKNRLNFTFTQNINNYYKNLDKQVYKLESKGEKCLINKKWLDEMCIKRPSLIIYFHYIPNGTDITSEEQKIVEVIREIKKNDEQVGVYVFKIGKIPVDPLMNQDGDMMPQRVSPLQSMLKKEYISNIPDDDIWKYTEPSNFYKLIFNYCRSYYLKYKKNIKERKKKANTKEEKIECNIMLGVLSVIKTKKSVYNKNKYLSEAYDIINDRNFNKSNYLYGNKTSDPKYILNEIREVSDWLFYKIMKIEKPTTSNSLSPSRSLSSNISGKLGNKVPDCDFQIKKYQLHLNRLTLLNKLNSNDKFILVEYNWLINKMKEMCELYEENIKIYSNKKKVPSLCLLYLRLVYYHMKLINYFKKNQDDLNNAVINGKNVPINRIDIITNNAYGRIPNYSYKDINNPLQKYDLEFNEEIFIKKFILVKKLNSIEALNDAIYKYIAKITSGYQGLNTNMFQNHFYFNGGIDLYLNLLKIFMINNNVFKDSNLNIDDNISNIMNSLQIFNLSEMRKYPKLYLHYLAISTNSLTKNIDSQEMNNSLKSKLLLNLLSIGNMRKLSENEENIFFKLLNDEQFTPVNLNIKSDISLSLKPVIVKLSNKNQIFNFSYNIKNGDESCERKILDLVEYNFQITTSLSKEKIKLNNLKVYFRCINEDKVINLDNKRNKEIVIREFKEELNELSPDNPLNLEHKIFMKYKKGKIYLAQVEFTLEKKSNIIYKIEIVNDINKMILITNLSKKVLNIKIPKEKLTVGVNQLNLFECEVNKEEFEEVHIAKLKMNFTSIPTYYKKTVPSTSMKSLLSSKNQMGKYQHFQDAQKQQIFGMPKNTNNYPNTYQNTLQPGFMNINPQVNLYNLNQNIVNQLPQQNAYMGLVPNENDLRTNVTINNNMTSMQNFFNKNATPVQNISLDNYKKVQMFGNIPPQVAQNNTPTPVLQSEVVQAQMPPPEFYAYNEENKSLDRAEKNFEIEFPDFESLLKNKNRFGALIKFLMVGQYEIKLNISYSIRHRDIEDYIEFNQEENLKFIVIEPFNLLKDKCSNNYLSMENKDNNIENEKKFLTNMNIQMNLLLTNQLNEDIIIKDIIVQLNQDKFTEKNKNLEVKSTLKDIIDSKTLPPQIKNQILKILKSSEYHLSFETKFTDEFAGSIGKVLLKWTTPSLLSYYSDSDVGLENENYFDFPFIMVKTMQLSYEYNTTINDSKDVIFNLKVRNISNQSRRLTFKIETGDQINFLVSGAIKQIHSIQAKGIINITFRLIPLIHNIELQLPAIKIKDMNQNPEEGIYSNYFYPEKLKII